MQGLRLAIRSLCATPVVTTVAILSLALGIGANTAIFSIVNWLVLRPLPVNDPARLALVAGGIPTYPLIPQLPGYTAPIWMAMRDRAEAFDGSCAWAPARFDLARGGEVQPVDGMLTSGDFFNVLGVRAVRGRTFTTEDDVAGAPPVVVISHRLWQRRFGGAVDVVGKPLTIERAPFIVVGVMPPAFYGPEVGRAFDIAIPVATAAVIGRSNLLDAWVFRIMVRLKADQSVDAATAIVRRLQPQIRDAGAPQAASYPDLDILKSPLTLVSGATGTSALRRRYAAPLTILVGLVALVLMIACVNIAAVLLARATARRHDLSVQRALGASGRRLAFQLLIESFVLSGLGTAVGLLFASWGAGWLTTRLSTPVTPVVLNLSADWRIVMFTATVAVLTTLAFGLAPAIRAARVDPIDAVHQYGRSRATGRWAAVLAIGQVSVALVLVVTASLFVRSFSRLATRPTGFDTDRMLLVNINTTHANLERAERLPLFMRAIEAIRAIPGISAVGGSSITPLDGISVISFVSLNGPPQGSDPERSVATNIVSSGWLAAYGIRLLEGRDFNADDVARTRPVAIVNEAFVHRFIPSGKAVGQVFFVQEGTPTTIIGVASDAVYNSIREPVPPTAYGHLGMAPVALTVSVQVSSGRSTQTAAAVAKTLNTLNPDLAFSFRELSSQVDATLNQDRVLAMLSSFFGALALLLALIGVYGVTSYGVTQRRGEIGIRMVLGAAPAAVVGLVLSRVALLVGAGIVVGAVVSAWASKFVASLLYGVEPRDPVTLIGAAAILAAVGAVAGWLPAWRASRIDPTEVLRET